MKVKGKLQAIFMGGCCTIAREPIQSIIPIPEEKKNFLNSNANDEAKEKKTSVCLMGLQKNHFLKKIIKNIEKSSQEFIEKFKNLDYGNFVKKRHGSIQSHYKFENKSLGHGFLLLFN